MARRIERLEAYLDTSAFIAFLDKSDSHHAAFKRLFAFPPALVTSASVIAERSAGERSRTRNHDGSPKPDLLADGSASWPDGTWPTECLVAEIGVKGFRNTAPFGHGSEGVTEP